MAGAKLRGERLDAFNALGDRGKPIYTVAPQILAVLRRHEAQYPGLADLFAIPQANEDSSGLDWYAPQQGPVIAWSAATSLEKHAAYERLAMAEQQIEQLRTHYAGAASDDAQLLSKLLAWVLHHPDDSHVFLVNGQPVITFWGFLLDGADRSMSPLHSLRAQLRQAEPPAPPPVLAPAAAALPAVLAQPISQAATVADVKTERRWPWWLWLLLLLLLIPLLLWLLRGCMPAASIPAIATEQNFTAERPQREAARAPTLPAQTVAPVAGPISSAYPPDRLGLGPGSANAPATPPEGSPSQALPSSPNTAETAPAVADSPAPDAQPESPAPAPTPPEQAPEDGHTEPADKAPANQTPPPFLAVPPALPDGPADFLQGGWQANSGIQDRDTGVPLKLHYEFNDGQGEAVLTGSNGVKCTAAVTANMQSSHLHITPATAAACNDGSNYELPSVECQPDAADPSAACTGQYGDRNFPLYMRQPR